ncbi:BamA/TamA family outer membrane protein [uncultured Alistipes sp.]|uniref:BamA/TamA family outer membrane protein n=1 Tax=uncultured Alistipes sp. TaxID=538949 RepID=UPI0025A9996F|nr:BamA/TamA family outer membrane protein [uncultured Alistipes sp.]
MFRRIVLFFMLFGSCFVVRAGVSPSGGPQSPATPAAVDSLSLPADTPVRRRSFVGRIIDYFGKSAVDRTFEKKIDLTFAGGPNYSKTNNFGIGVLAAGLYRIDRTDSLIPPSDVSVFATVSISGFYSVGVEGNTYFRRSRSKMDYQAMFVSAPRDLWGIGYCDARHNPETSYVEKQYKVHARYVYRVLPHTYVGSRLSFQHTDGTKFDATGDSYIRHQKHSYTLTGIGAIVEYDSRDFIPGPWRGLYASLEGTVFPKVLGSCETTLYRATFTFDWYQRVWKDCTLAFDFYGEFNSAAAPWPMLARMGGSRRMRGYYEGRYTDNCLLTVQLELRQRIWRRFGCTVWGGAGNVFSERSGDRFDWSHTLPNYGVGLRWEFKKRVNVRVDYGFGRKTSGFLLSINEAF